MKREAKLLLQKATNSMIVCVDHFNRVSDTGRPEIVLILLDHAFEMLLKASLVERGAKIREKGEENTIGFDHCVRKALTEGNVRFLTDDQALTLQIINNYRDAGQHYMLDISEELLYTTAQVGITLFKTILKAVFDLNLGMISPSAYYRFQRVHRRILQNCITAKLKLSKLSCNPANEKRTEALARLNRWQSWMMRYKVKTILQAMSS